MKGQGDVDTGYSEGLPYDYRHRKHLTGLSSITPDLVGVHTYNHLSKDLGDLHKTVFGDLYLDLK